MELISARDIYYLLNDFKKQKRHFVPSLCALEETFYTFGII